MSIAEPTCDDGCNLPSEEVLLLTAPRPLPPEPDNPVGITETLAFLLERIER